MEIHSAAFTPRVQRWIGADAGRLTSLRELVRAVGLGLDNGRSAEEMEGRLVRLVIRLADGDDWPDEDPRRLIMTRVALDAVRVAAGGPRPPTTMRMVG